MSSLAGVFFFDQRAVPDELAADLTRSVDPAYADALEQFRAPGLSMARAAVWINLLPDSTPQAGPSGSRISFDRRLDNREDLLLRLRRHATDVPSDSDL